MSNSDTLSRLKSKANHLQSKLRLIGIFVPNNRKVNLLAITLGFKNWDALKESYSRNPLPYPCYKPNAERLGAELSISIANAQSVIDEMYWPISYVPLFNTLPNRKKGMVCVPTIIAFSHIFSFHKARDKNCKQKRIVLFNDSFKSSRDHILYSGESLNQYDETIFFSLLSLHPVDCPVGREFSVSQRDIEVMCDRNYSPISLDASIKRMTMCRISIPAFNFFGPLISTNRRIKSKVKNKLAYKISFNPELTKLYNDPLYSLFMDEGGLFHNYPNQVDSKKKYSFKSVKDRMDALKNENIREYMGCLKEDWPTKECDISAIYAIIAKSASKGGVSFKLVEDVEFFDDEEAVVLKMPDWWVLSYKHFYDTYGDEAGPLIFQKAMERFTSQFFQ